MTTKHFKSICYISAFSILIGLPILFGSCKHKDPKVEYMSLVSNFYEDAHDGWLAADEYIDYFYKRNSPYINDVYQIRHEYAIMESLFEKDYNNYQELLISIDNAETQLSTSKYECIRNTYKTMYGFKKHELLDPILDNITSTTFESWLSQDAEAICRIELPNWDAERCDVISIDEPTLSDDGFSKTCTATLRVYLRGNIIGIETGTAKVFVTGKAIVDAQYPRYQRVDYTILEKPSSFFL